MDQKREEKGMKSNSIEFFKEAFAKVCSESTAHGLPNIFSTKNWIVRIFWLLLFFAGSGAALYCKETFLISILH